MKLPEKQKKKGIVYVYICMYKEHGFRNSLRSCSPRQALSFSAFSFLPGECVGSGYAVYMTLIHTSSLCPSHISSLYLFFLYLDELRGLISSINVRYEDVVRDVVCILCLFIYVYFLLCVSASCDCASENFSCTFHRI